MSRALLLSAAFATACGSTNGQAPRATPSAPSMEVLAASERPVELSADPVRVALGADAELRRTWSDPSSEIFVVLRGLAAEVQPGVVFQVYLESAEGERARLGTINFFGAARPGADDQRFYSFQAPADLRSAALRGDPVVTIEPAGEPDPQAKPRVGRIELVSKAR